MSMKQKQVSKEHMTMYRLVTKQHMTMYRLVMKGNHFRLVTKGDYIQVSNYDHVQIRNHGMHDHVKVGECAFIVVGYFAVVRYFQCC